METALTALTWDDRAWLCDMGWLDPASKQAMKSVGCAWLCACGWMGKHREGYRAEAELNEHYRKAHPETR